MNRSRLAIWAATAAAVVAVLIYVFTPSESTDRPQRAQSGPSTTVDPDLRFPDGSPLVTTTTIEGTPISDLEAYRAAGLDATQAQCVVDSGVGGEWVATPGPTALDAIVLEAGDRRVAVPSTVRTGTELSRLMLDTVAAACAPPELLDRVAAADGAAEDETALTDDLPQRLDWRRAAGATDEELKCLDVGFHAAPVRLASLVAQPTLVELSCVPLERLAEWRRAALDGGLRDGGATDAERACLLGDEAALAALGGLVDVASLGELDTRSVESSPCLSAERSATLAVDLVASGTDFGGEPLVR